MDIQHRDFSNLIRLDILKLERSLPGKVAFQSKLYTILECHKIDLVCRHKSHGPCELCVEIQNYEVLETKILNNLM